LEKRGAMGEEAGQGTSEQPTLPDPRRSPFPGSTPTVIPGEIVSEPTVPAHPVRPNVPRKLGPYELQEELGHGGMGMVFRARHERLGTLCALKVLIAGEHASPESIARFQREAASVARMGKHPNIVTVFDLGQEGSLAYYAMELVEGTTLAARLRERPFTPVETAALLERVARALAFAHERGVVHRDVKPENIVVRSDGEPQVMDFGLALDQNASARLSVSGDIMGTPAYMAPEQARGDVEGIDARTDVYAIGAVLYEMLTGIPPHRGTDLPDLLRRVAAGDIVPPRRFRSDVPRDLEPVCLACLAPDRDRRYATATALADDLARFQRGEPVHARPVSALERALRFVARRRAVLLPSALAVLAAATFGGHALMVHLRTAGAVEASLSMGRLYQRRDRAREAYEAYQKALTLDDSNVEARAGFAWAEREVRRLDAVAEENRRRAEEAERVLLKARLVSKVLGRWSRLAGALRELEGIFYEEGLHADARRERIAGPWRRVQAFIDDTPGDSASQATMLALAGWARRLAWDEAEGIEMMRKASSVDPEVPYGAFMEALVLSSRYVEEQHVMYIDSGPVGLQFGPSSPETDSMRAKRGRIDRLLSVAQRAPVWGQQGADEFQCAIDAMRSMQAEDPARAERELTDSLGVPELGAFTSGLLLARAKVRYRLARMPDSLEDVSEVLEVRPMDYEARDTRASIHLALAILARTSGKDPRDLLQTCLEELGWCARARPSDSAIAVSRGCALMELGDAQEARGLDPTNAYQGAVEASDAALAQTPGLLQGLLNRASALWRLGSTEQARGIDARARFRKAMEDCDGAIAASPTCAMAFNLRGTCLAALGSAEQARGLDPMPRFQEAIADFDRALASSAGDVATLANRSDAFVRVGKLTALRGIDSRVWFEKAIADLDAALERGPGFLAGLNARGGDWQLLGDAEAARGIDPRPRYERALADHEAALKLAPDLAVARLQRASVHLRMAEAEVLRGLDPRPSYDAALEGFGKALEVNPGSAYAWASRGSARFRLGQAEASQGVGARGSYEAALSDYEEALKRNPGFLEVRINRGAARIVLAQVQLDAGEDPRPTIEAALADFAEALKAGSSAPLHNNRANAYLCLARAEAKLGADPHASLERGLEETRRATEIVHGFWQTLATRAQIQEEMGDLAGAVESYKAAIAACGDASPSLRLELQRVQGKLGGGK